MIDTGQVTTIPIAGTLMPVQGYQRDPEVVAIPWLQLFKGVAISPSQQCSSTASRQKLKHQNQLNGGNAMAT